MVAVALTLTPQALEAAKEALLVQLQDVVLDHEMLGRALDNLVDGSDKLDFLQQLTSWIKGAVGGEDRKTAAVRNSCRQMKIRTN